MAVQLTCCNALYNSTESMSSGADSIRNLIQSLNIGTVVNITRIEKRNVHIGSAIVQLGFT